MSSEPEGPDRKATEPQEPAAPTDATDAPAPEQPREVEPADIKPEVEPRDAEPAPEPAEPAPSDLSVGAMATTGDADQEGNRYSWVRPLLVRVGINAVVLFLALLFFSILRLPARQDDGTVILDVPLLEITNAGLIELLLFGLALALVDEFVRPILTALFGKYVIRTYGLLILVINALIFWLAIAIVNWLTDIQISVPDPPLLWMFVVAVLVSTLMAAANTLLGLNRPRLDDLGYGQAFWHVVDRLPLSGRSRIVENLRLGEVRQVMYEYAIDISLAGTPLERVRRIGDRLLGRDPDEFDDLTTPAKVRVMLQQLGPTYVKIGQMVSSRADLLPVAWRDELEKLQNDVPPAPYEDVERMVRKELGRSPDKLFRDFDREPVAAASLAQVHKAHLLDGTPVAVKVQRPDVGALVRADLGVIQDLAEQGERGFGVARQLNLQGMVQEFGAGVLQELDYNIEAYHVLRLGEVLEGMDGVHVPRVYLERSATRVITMEFVNGVKLTDLPTDNQTVDRDLAARRLLRAFVKQVFIDGFFHADPHPGNIVIDPETGTLSLLDMGLVGELDASMRIQLINVLWALRERDPNGLATALLGVCERRGKVDEMAFRAGIQAACYRYWLFGRADFTGLLTAIFEVLSANNLRLDSALTLAFKALIQAEELMRLLSPRFPIIETMFQEGVQQLQQEFTPDRVVDLAKEELTTTVMELGKRVPSLRGAALSWIDQFQKGKLVVTLDTSDLRKGLDSVGSVSTNLTIGLIVAGQLIALALVIGVLVVAEDVSADLVSILAVVFIGFLIFSVVMVRRVSKRPNDDF